MKILAYILLLSFVSTVADPFVSDLHACEEVSDVHTDMSCCKHSDEAEDFDATEEGDATEKEDDMNHKCSLLCQCDCCGHVTAFNIEFFNLSPQEHHTIYKHVISVTYHFDLINSIWQPPRRLLS